MIQFYSDSYKPLVRGKYEIFLEREFQNLDAAKGFCMGYNPLKVRWWGAHREDPYQQIIMSRSVNIGRGS